MSDYTEKLKLKSRSRFFKLAIGVIIAYNVAAFTIIVMLRNILGIELETWIYVVKDLLGVVLISSIFVFAFVANHLLLRFRAKRMEIMRKDLIESMNEPPTKIAIILTVQYTYLSALDLYHRLGHNFEDKFVDVLIYTYNAGIDPYKIEKPGILVRLYGWVFGDYWLAIIKDDSR